MDISLPYEFIPRNYQLPTWNYFIRPGEEGLRGSCLWHRRAGKDLLAINLAVCKAHQRVGTYWHLLPTYKQGRAIVWNGMTRDGRKFLSHIPEALIDKVNNTEMTVFFKNGSIYQVVGTDNPDLLVGTNPVGCIFSEYSLHDPAAWEYVRPILAENGGWSLFIFTARGKNHAFRLHTNALKNPLWYAETLKAGDNGTKRPDGSPVIPDIIIDEERKSGMAEEIIQQEFYCSFEAPLIGSYYGDIMTEIEQAGQITKVPYEPRLQVDTYWDLGVGDSTSIWFIQVYGMENRIIDYYEASGEGIQHYARTLLKKKYVYNRHYAPHDIEVREFSSEGRSRKDVARSLGIRFTTVPKHGIEDGIEAVRNTLRSCWFDAEKCERGIDALRNYRKEWDEKAKVYRGRPNHDWSSHGADAFRTFAMGHRRRKRQQGPPQSRGVDDFDYLSTAQSQ